MTDRTFDVAASEAGKAAPISRHTSILRRVGIVFAILGVVAVGAWLLRRSVEAGHEAKSGARPQTTPVAVGPARRADVPIYLEGLGTATAFQTITVRPRVDGQLDRVTFREGQEVHAGELLAEIDPRPFQVQLDQAEGSLARDSAQLANAKADLERYHNLIEQDLISKQQFDAQVATVAQLGGSLQMDQAAIDAARLQLTYCRITAPIAGRAGLRLVDAGNMVHAADPNGIVVLTQVRPMAVLFTLPEDDVQRVLAKAAQATPLTATAFDRNGAHPLATGRLLTSDNQIDPATGTFRLKAVFDNANDELFPNQFVNIRLLLDTHAGSIVVPQASVQRGQQGTFVFTVGPDRTAQLKTVTVGATLGDDVEIAGGVAEGDTVVIDGADRLKNGGLVEIQDPAAPQGDSPPRKKKS
jgi:membrane fusion protein, multidrug efflux system